MSEIEMALPDKDGRIWHYEGNGVWNPYYIPESEGVRFGAVSMCPNNPFRYLLTGWLGLVPCTWFSEDAGKTWQRLV